MTNRSADIVHADGCGLFSANSNLFRVGHHVQHPEPSVVSPAMPLYVIIYYIRHREKWAFLFMVFADSDSMFHMPDLNLSS
jgi:hypothetical protein